MKAACEAKSAQFVGGSVVNWGSKKRDQLIAQAVDTFAGSLRK